MERVKTALRAAEKHYVTAAIIVLNSLLLFVLINVLADGALDLHKYFRKRAVMKECPYSFRRYHESLDAVHPNMKSEEIGKLIHETRRLTQGYEPYTQFREKPYDTEYVNVNPVGFRPIGGQAAWPPRAEDFVVFVFGGSTSFGYGVPDNETIASHLQEVLRERIGVAAKVYNFGRGSYMSIQERVLFEKLLLAGHIPDVAVFIDGLNDFCFFDGIPAYTRDLQRFMNDGDTPSFHRIVRELPIVKFVDTCVLKSNNPNVPSHLADKPISWDARERMLREHVQRYRRNKQLTESAAEAFGVEPIFVWQPVPVYKYDQEYNIFGKFKYDGYMPTVKPGYDLMARAHAEEPFGHNFLWLADMQEHEKRPLYVDAVHYSGAMSRKIAENIADLSLNRGLLACGVNSRALAHAQR